MAVKKKSVEEQVRAALPEAIARLEQAKEALAAALADALQEKHENFDVVEIERAKTQDLLKQQKPIVAEANRAAARARRLKSSTAKSEARDRSMELWGNITRARKLREEEAKKQVAETMARRERLNRAHWKADIAHKKAALAVAKLKEKMHKLGVWDY